MIINNQQNAMASIQETEVLGSFEVRAAAFQRIVHTVWSFTKKNRDVFPLDLENIEDGDTVREQLAGLILQVNLGSANAYVSTRNTDTLAKMAMLVVKAFGSDPEIYGKMVTCRAAQLVGSSMTGNMDNMSPAIRRANENVDASKHMNELGKKIMGKNVVPTVEIRNDGRDDYIQFTVTEIIQR